MSRNRPSRFLAFLRKFEFSNLKSDLSNLKSKRPDRNTEPVSLDLQLATSNSQLLDDGERSAFTIVEVLTVVSIIAILLGMVGAASHAARQKAYRAQAATEAGEIANACRAFWIASGNWPNGPYWPGGEGMAGQTTKIDKNGPIYNSLVGKDRKLNPVGTVFLQFDENRFDDGGAYSDPWGNAYEISFAEVNDDNTITHHFRTSVTFPMRNRREYYGNQFE